VRRIEELITGLILPCGTREGQADLTTNLVKSVFLESCD
jgi:hypothetical protein